MTKTTEQRLALKLTKARQLLRDFVMRIDAQTPTTAFKAAEQTSPKHSLLGEARRFLDE